jgi:excisionase family DNA binding protein
MENLPTKLLRAVEVAEILQISKSATYRLLQSGELPTLRFAGKTVRVRRTDLEAFIAGQQPGTVSANQCSRG